MRNKIEISKDELQKLYLENRRSTQEISKLYNCNAETIRRKLIFYGINRRYHEIKVKIQRNKLRYLYINKRFSTVELAKRYNCSQWTIRSNLIKNGIKLRSSSDFLKWKPPQNQIKPLVSPSQNLSYIIGVLLGGGWLYNYKNNYFIGLDTIEYNFNKSFYKSLRAINLNPNIFKKGIKYWRTIASSKLFYQWFNNLNMKEIRKIVNFYPLDFIRGIYESEGCLGLNFDKSGNKRYLIITIVSCEEETIDIMREFIERLGFAPKLNLRKPKPPRKPIWALTLGRQKEIKEFMKIINPVIKNKT